MKKRLVLAVNVKVPRQKSESYRVLKKYANIFSSIYWTFGRPKFGFFGPP